MPRLSSVRQTSGLYERVKRMTKEIRSFRPSTEASRNTISNGRAAFPFSTRSSSAGSLRLIASPSSLTLSPAASRVARRAAPAFSTAARCSGLTSTALAAFIDRSAAAPAMPSTESVQARTCRATPIIGDSPALLTTAVRLRAAATVERVLLTRFRDMSMASSGNRTPSILAAKAAFSRRPVAIATVELALDHRHGAAALAATTVIFDDAVAPAHNSSPQSQGAVDNEVQRCQVNTANFPACAGRESHRAHWKVPSH